MLVSTPTEDMPSSAPLTTVGQIQDYLAQFDRDVPLYPYDGTDKSDLVFRTSPIDYRRDGVDLPNGLMVSIT